MRGLLAGAIGGVAKAVDQIADKQIATNQHVDMRAQIAQIELEKHLRIDEVKRNRDVQDIGRTASAKAEAAPILARGDAEGAIAKTSTPGYLDSLRQKTAAEESSSSRASAGLTSDRRTMENEVNNLRRQLSQATDQDERATLSQRITDLSAGLPGAGKSFGDMVAAAGHYSRMAQSLRKDAEASYVDSEKRQLLDQASQYEQQADAILQETRGRRLGQAGIKSATPSGSGERESVSKSGRPIVQRDRKWVYK